MTETEDLQLSDQAVGALMINGAKRHCACHQGLQAKKL